MINRKQPVFFPFYNIHSDLVKTSLGLKDNRSIEQFFKEAGIEVKEIGKKKCVTCEDLLNVTTNRQLFSSYQARSELSKRIDELE